MHNFKVPQYRYVNVMLKCLKIETNQCFNDQIRPFLIETKKEKTTDTFVLILDKKEWTGQSWILTYVILIVLSNQHISGHP